MKAAATFLSWALSLLIGAVACVNILDAWRASDVTQFARFIETRSSSRSLPAEDEIKSQDFIDFEQANDIEDIARVCTDELSRSALTIRLAGLESFRLQSPKSSAAPQKDGILANSATPAPSSLQPYVMESLTITQASRDANELNRRRALAIDAASQRLRCSPTDGNAWLWLAMLLEQSFKDREHATAASRLSYKLAPAEKWVMSPRFAFVAPSFELGANALAAEFLADLGRIVRNFPVREVAALYVGAGPRVQDAIRREAAGLPDRQRKQIASAADELGVTIRLDP
jgi:hypothetical protein